jgi:hypothetical protein
MVPDTLSNSAPTLPPAKAQRRHPPGPKGLPLVGSLPQLGRDVLAFFEECSTYGDVAAFRLGAWNCVLLNHPDLAEYVLVKNHRNFVKHRFFWRHVTAIFGKGLLTSEGEFWQRQRRLAAPAFSPSRLSRYGEIMVQYADNMVRRWEPGKAIDVHREVMDLTLRIAAKTLFDADTPEHVAEIHDGFEDILLEISARFRRPFRIPDVIPTPGNLRYRRGLAKIDNLVARIIEDRQRSPGDRGDLLSTLMAARDESGGRDIFAWLEALGILDEAGDLARLRGQPSLQLIGDDDHRMLDLGTLLKAGMRGVPQAPVAMTTARAVQEPWSVSTSQPPPAALTARTETPVRTGSARARAKPASSAAKASALMKPSGSGPAPRAPGRVLSQFGVRRRREAQLCERQRSPARPCSSTTWSMPCPSRQRLMASPDWPPPMITTSHRMGYAFHAAARALAGPPASQLTGADVTATETGAPLVRRSRTAERACDCATIARSVSALASPEMAKETRIAR